MVGYILMSPLAQCLIPFLFVPHCGNSLPGRSFVLHLLSAFLCANRLQCQQLLFCTNNTITLSQSCPRASTPSFDVIQACEMWLFQRTEQRLIVANGAYLEKTPEGQPAGVEQCPIMDYYSFYSCPLNIIPRELKKVPGLLLPPWACKAFLPGCGHAQTFAVGLRLAWFVYSWAESCLLVWDDQVAEETVADDDMIMIKGCREARAVTVLLRGANDYMLDEMERSLHDAFCIVKRVLESGEVVPGMCARSWPGCV
jgi:TCP-1/cpn60 chaperonin family